jgi:hypothetical protein
VLDLVLEGSPMSSRYLFTDLRANELDEIEIRVHVMNREYLRISCGSYAVQTLGRYALLFQASGVSLTLSPPPTRCLDIEGCPVLACDEPPNLVKIGTVDFTEEWTNCHDVFSRGDESRRVADIASLHTTVDTDDAGRVRITVTPLTSQEVRDSYDDERCGLFPLALHCGVPEMRIVRPGRINPDVLRRDDSAFTNDIPLSMVIEDRDYVHDWIEAARPHLRRVAEGPVLLSDWSDNRRRRKEYLATRNVARPRE